MNQKKCTQCKNLIAITAPTCLYCGRPNKFVTNNYVKRKWDKVNKTNNVNKVNKVNIFKRLISKKILFVFIIILIVFFIRLNN